jgi:hypothetical protein
MKTTLTLLAAIVMPGGLILLSIGLATVLLARYRAQQAQAAVTASSVTCR